MVNIFNLVINSLKKKKKATKDYFAYQIDGEISDRLNNIVLEKEKTKKRQDLRTSTMDVDIPEKSVQYC